MFKGIRPVETDGTNAQAVWEQMAAKLVMIPEVRKELSHLGAITVDFNKLRSLALTKSLGSITVEGNTVKGQKEGIYRGSEDLGNTFYTEWVKQNMPDTATWHNDEHKGV